MSLSWKEMFPGFSYVGTSSFDCVRAHLGGTTGVRLSIGAQAPEILNLDGVFFADAAGKLHAAAALGIRVSASSVYLEQEAVHGVTAVANGREFHSAPERHPWLVFEWDGEAPVEVAILNRPDAYGVRSQSLVVEVRRDGRWTPFHDHQGTDRLLALMRNVAGCVPSEVFAAPWRTGDFGALRRAVVSSVLGPASGPSELAAQTWVLPLIDVYGARHRPDDEQLLAAYLAACIAAGRTMTGNMAICRWVLDSVPRLLAAESEINRRLQEAGLEAGYAFSRHGLLKSRLRARSSDYLQLTEDVMRSLEAAGYGSFICYGTLLGAVREQDFIAHDDDLDIVMVGHATSEDGCARERGRAIEALTRSGFEVACQPTLNFHVHAPGNPDVSVDVFPSWTDGGKVWLYMQGMQWAPVEPSLVFPLGSVSLRGKVLPAPGSPGAFLERRYGAGWSVPDRFFEWPYPLHAGPAAT